MTRGGPSDAAVLPSDLGHASPEAFRAALEAMPALDREGWVDRALGIDDPFPPDGPELPSDGGPYLPCSVANLLAAIDGAKITQHDVVVDVGAGLGRACGVVHWATRAQTVGIEIQPQLAARARRLFGEAPRMSFVEGEASAVAATMTSATVFFLYCPFSGRRLERVLERIEMQASARPVRLVLVGMADLQRPGWRRMHTRAPEVDVYASKCVRA